MATNQDKDPKKLVQHPEPARIKGRKEAAQLREHKAEDDVTPVPAVTADVDETPKFIRVGAAVLLACAVGFGLYIWFGNGIPSDRNPHYAQQAAALRANSGQPLPNPFAIAFEPSLDPNFNADGTWMRETAIAESIEPMAPADYTIGNGAAGTKSQPVKMAVADAGGGTVVYLFEFDSAEVPETKELTSIARHATANGLCLDVRAYTDEHGRPAYNQRLSERRARAIGDYLIAHGVPADRVSVHGMGPTHKFANDAQDRRAEVVEVRR